ncbi:MAG: ester cyclase [Actinomycetota bacterium]
MKPSASAQVMRTYLDEVGIGGRLDLIDELALPDMVDEINQAFGGPPGRDGLKAHVKGFVRNVTELEFSFNRIVGGDDEVMAWWSFTGVHTGPWLGRTPTNETVTGTVFSFFDLADGRISRYRLWLHARFADAEVVVDSSRPDAPVTTTERIAP